MSLNKTGHDATRYLQDDFIRRIRSRFLLPDDADPREVGAVALQRSWRDRMKYVSARALRQERLCRKRREEMQAGLRVDCDACASAGKKSTDVMFRNRRKAWKDADELLFKGVGRVQMSDRGDNWNERWQEALSLPSRTQLDKNYRRASLDAVYADFVHTAMTYGRTIISEYFLHEYMKSVRPKHLGGVAGGKKYLWRGIMFKLADGSKGPYGGSDEAAAKAMGHELRATSEYLKTGVSLCVPPMCLLDYKGFRMLAQAFLPIGNTSLRMGTSDGGQTILNDCPKLNDRSARAAKKLGLRAHVVGGKVRRMHQRDPSSGRLVSRSFNVGGKVLHAAADVEGHKGADGRLYLLDLARAFPPEDPSATPHLSGMLSVSARVVVKNPGERERKATVTKAHATLLDYDILYPDGGMDIGAPAHVLRDLRLFIFYRLLRPEFVRDRGREVLRKVNLPPGHQFPSVSVTNPMMFAIECSRAAARDAHRSASAPQGNRHRYAAGDPELMKGLVRSSASGKRGHHGMPAQSLPAVAESTGDRTPSSSEASGAGKYERFEVAGDKAGRGCYHTADTIVGEGLGDGEGVRENGNSESFKRKAMEFGIEFIVPGDKYYEGFQRSEMEEDPEELRRRGGVGYRPFDGDTEEVHLGYDNMAEVNDDTIDDTGRLVLGAGTESNVFPKQNQTLSHSRPPHQSVDFGIADEALLGVEGRGQAYLASTDDPASTGDQASTGDPWAGTAGESSYTEEDSDMSDPPDNYESFETESATSSLTSSVAAAGFHRSRLDHLMQAPRQNSNVSYRRPPQSPVAAKLVPERRSMRFATHTGVGGDTLSVRSRASQSSSRGTSPSRGGSRRARQDDGQRDGYGYDHFRHSSMSSLPDVSVASSPSVQAGEDNSFVAPTRNGAKKLFQSVDGSTQGKVSRGGHSGSGSGFGRAGDKLFSSERSRRGLVTSGSRSSASQFSNGGGHSRRLGSGSVAGEGNDYQGFVPASRGDDDFLEDVAADLPPPQLGSTAYDGFQSGSDRTVVSTHFHGGSARLGPASPPRNDALEPSSATSPSPETDIVPSEPNGRPPIDARAQLDQEDSDGDGPVPLSPDALTAFSNGDPDARERNREVTEATQFLLTVLVPSTATLLCKMPPVKVARLDLATTLHRYGINMRHIGLLRAYIPKQQRGPRKSRVARDGLLTAAARAEASAAGGEGWRSSSRRGVAKSEWFEGKTSAAIMRDRALVEVVVRTLKLVLREFQRHWMKAEQSSSEQGMHMLVTQFLNLVTGQHERCGLFWRENVTTGICQRFGTVALTEPERADLWNVCSERPELLHMIMKALIEATGIRFKESVRNKLWRRKTDLVSFKFRLSDIRDIDPVVTPMTVFADSVADRA